MNLFQNLQQLKKIQPDEKYLLHSKSRLLNSRGIDFQTYFRTHTRASLVSLALVAFAIFALVKYLSPSRMVAIDPRSLKVEAQAIDLQLKLTNLNYSELEEDVLVNETTIPAAKPKTVSSKPALDPLESALEELLR